VVAEVLVVVAFRLLQVVQEVVLKEEDLYLEEQEILHQQVLLKEIMGEQDQLGMLLEAAVEDLLL
tara:strand:- start:152 stop:346 length:195 start_codon:yes stop_codon:yes gene_type:complete